MERTSEPLPTRRSRWTDVIGLGASLLICFGVAALGALYPPGEWYATLRRPLLTPPNWIFGPVWTALYAMMAVAAWLVWRWRPAGPVGLPLALFAAQLVLNAAWSWLFFGLERPGLAFIDILLLWLALVATIAAFRTVSVTAAWLLVPYLAWLSFAAYLNYGFWRLNG